MGQPVQGASSASVDGRLGGRDAELSHLDRCLGEARQGTPRFIPLSGASSSQTPTEPSNTTANLNATALQPEATAAAAANGDTAMGA